MTAIREVNGSEDVNIVAELAREVWTNHYEPIIGREQVDYMLNKFQSPPAIRSQLGEGVEYYLIEVDATPAGYLALEPEPSENQLKLSKLYVCEAYRGRGLGTELLNHAKERARDLDVDRIWLRVNKHNDESIGWYEHQGFVKKEADKKDIGNGFYMDDYIMELKL
jgi:ribosomal protein S18 acetylase RimI-like enzyme